MPKEACHGHPSALSQTCKTVRAECTQVLYASDTFIIPTGHGPGNDKLRPLREFRRKIGPQSSAALRRIIIKHHDMLAEHLWDYTVKSGGLAETPSLTQRHARKHKSWSYKFEITVYYQNKWHPEPKPAVLDLKIDMHNSQDSSRALIQEVEKKLEQIHEWSRHNE